MWVIKHRSATEAKLRARLNEDGPNYEYIVPGGAWWRHVQIHIAERDGDVERVAQLKAEQEQSLAELLG